MNVIQRFAMRGAWSVLAMTLLVCAAQTVRAQDVEPLKPHKWSVKAGFYMPTDKSLNNQTSDFWYLIGFDYFPNLRYRPLQGDVHLGMDVAWRTVRSQEVHVFTPSARITWSLNPSNLRSNFYGGLGVGIYFIETPFLGETVQPGLQFILGVNLTDRVFLEGNYNLVSGFTDTLGNGVRADGFNVAAGIRF